MLRSSNRAISAFVALGLAYSKGISFATYKKTEYESWIMLTASIDPPTVQVLGFMRDRYSIVKKEAERRANGRSCLVLGTHQSMETMGRLVYKWMMTLGIPEQYHEPFVQALGRAINKATGADDAVSYPVQDLVHGEQGSQADGDEG